MKDLNHYEIEKIEQEVSEFVENMALLGIACIVVLNGRSLNKCAYSNELIEVAPDMLRLAHLSATQRKVQESRSLNS